MREKSKKLRIFISSVFSEEGKEWELRKRISIKLNELGHETWLWEENGKIEQNKTGKDWFEIVFEAIRFSDLVITFYKNRAGDLSFWHPDIPFLPTDYEIALAIKSSTPVYLYIIKSYLITDDLRGIKTLFFDKIVIKQKPRYCNNENEFVTKAISDVKTLTGLTDNISIIHLDNNIENPTNWLEQTLFETSQLLKLNDYKTAFNIVKSNSEFNKIFVKTNQEKTLMARYLGYLANIYAHQANYKEAIIFTRKSIRLFLEVGEWNEMYGQVQALSGIQNMAGFKSAQYLNEYGFRSVKNYKNLLSGYNDSKASILRDLGYYNEALKFIERDWESSTYSAAKYAHILGFSSKRNNLGISRTIMQENVLPKARKEQKFLAYVLRESAILAIKDHDTYAAINALNEAEIVCQEMGMIHTQKSILKIKSENKLI